MKKHIALIVVLNVAVAAFAAGTDTLNIRDFGATGDGVTKDTAAIQKALDTSAAAGGGTVVVPNGIFLTGSIVIGANTTLQLDSHAEILGSSDIADYPLQQVRWEGEFRDGHRALISASNAANVTVSGGGTIFGPPITLSHLRNPRGPVLIELSNCTNAVLENFTAQYEQLWSIHPLLCKNFTARGLTIRTVNFNSDGIDIDSCDGVTIERCDINTGDDAISLKSGRGLAAQNLARPTQNVVIRDCRLESSIYAAIGIGTEMSGGVRDVKIENCIIAGRQNAIYIKSREGRGGFIENISGENLVVLKSPTFVGIDLKSKGIQATDPVTGDTAKWPLVKNINFKNVRVQDVRELVAAQNIPAERPMDGFSLDNISGTCERGIKLANMTGVKFSKLQVSGYNGPLISTSNVQGTGLDNNSTALTAEK
jgi:polygalacturonase